MRTPTIVDKPALEQMPPLALSETPRGYKIQPRFRFWYTVTEKGEGAILEGYSNSNDGETSTNFVLSQGGKEKIGKTMFFVDGDATVKDHYSVSIKTWVNDRYQYASVFVEAAEIKRLIGERYLKL